MAPLATTTSCLKKTAHLFFLSQLRQISTEFNNFCQQDCEEANIMRVALIFHKAATENAPSPTVCRREFMLNVLQVRTIYQYTPIMCWRAVEKLTDFWRVNWTFPV